MEGEFEIPVCQTQTSNGIHSRTIKNAPPGLLNKVRGKSNHFSLSSGNAIDDDDNIVLPDDFNIETEVKLKNNNGQGHGSGRRQLLEGTRKLLVVRCSFTDASPNVSAEKIAEDVFDLPTGSDVYNLKSMYQQCSHDQLTFVPADVPEATNGVYEISMGYDITSTNNNNYHQNQVNSILNAELGDVLANGVADYLFYVWPRNTQNEFIAYAIGIPGTTAVFAEDSFGNVFITEPNYQAHEMGHLIGLGKTTLMNRPVWKSTFSWSTSPFDVFYTSHKQRPLW